MNRLAFVLLLVGNGFAFCQNNTKITENDSVRSVATISHKVALGETIIMVARKYHITPRDIYELNPDAVDGITESTILMLPADKVRLPEIHKKPKTEHAYAASPK